MLHTTHQHHITHHNTRVGRYGAEQPKKAITDGEHGGFVEQLGRVGDRQNQAGGPGLVGEVLAREVQFVFRHSKLEIHGIHTHTGEFE